MLEFALTKASTRLVAPGRSRPFRCHWQDIGSEPSSATLNMAGWPTETTRETGWVRMVGGAAVTVSVATELVSAA